MAGGRECVASTLGTEAPDPLSSALGAGPEAWEFFTALIESMPVVPYIDAPDEQLTLYIGPQAREILGLESGDIVNPHFDETINHLHPDDRERAIAETFRLMDEGGGRQEWRFIRPDTGETIWIEERLSVVEVDGRRLSPGVLLDITSQKRADAEIADHVRALERIDEISRTFTDLVVSSGDVTEILSKLAEHRRRLGGAHRCDRSGHRARGSASAMVASCSSKMSSFAASGGERCGSTARTNLAAWRPWPSTAPPWRWRWLCWSNAKRI